MVNKGRHLKCLSGVLFSFVMVDEIEDSELDEEITDLAVVDPADFDTVSDDLWQELEKLKNPYLKDPVFLKKALKQEKPVHKEAFLFWSQLEGKYRTDKAIADKFEVSAAVVGRWRKSFNWDLRRDYMRQEEMEQMKDAASRTLTDEVTKMISISNTAIGSFQQQVASGAVRIGVTEFIRLGEFLIKLRREILGDSSGNGDGNVSVEKIENLLSTSGDDIKLLMMAQMKMMISGNVPLPHDGIIDAKVSEQVQEAIIIDEIGEDEQIDLDEEYDE